MKPVPNDRPDNQGSDIRPASFDLPGIGTSEAAAVPNLISLPYLLAFFPVFLLIMKTPAHQNLVIPMTSSQSRTGMIITFLILALAASWIFSLFALPLFYPEAGSCDIRLLPGEPRPHPDPCVIPWTIDVEAPVFMFAPCTIEADVGGGSTFHIEKAAVYAVYGSGDDEIAVSREFRRRDGDETFPLREVRQMTVRVPPRYHGKKLTRVYGSLPVETEASQFPLIMTIRAPTARSLFVMPFVTIRNNTGQTENGGVLGQEYVFIDRYSGDVVA